MRVLSAALLLAGSFAAAKLSLPDTIRAVRESICETSDGTELRINLEGPLNVLRAHELVSNSIIAKKRLFAPPGTVDYKYVYDEKAQAYKYEVNPEDGPIRDFPGADPKAMEYLHAYYKTMRIMFKAVEGRVFVSNSYKNSLYKYLTKVSDDVRAHFFAMLLVLADCGSEAITTTYKKAAVEEATYTELRERIVSIEFSCAGSSDPVLTMPLKVPTKERGKPSYADDAQAVADFFANYGGTDVQKEYGLGHHSDGPGALILTYIYEFASDYRFLGKVYEHVDAILKQAYGGAKLAAVHARFFTSGGEAGPDYTKAYEALEKMTGVGSRGVFPFDHAHPPQRYELVFRYDEKTRKVEPDTSYNDCTEIELYNLFCCLLFVPQTRSYSTAHLEARGCSPSEEFKSFFTQTVSGPERGPERELHQDWAQLLQGPHPTAGGKSKDALKDGRRALIRYYQMSKKNASVELESDIGSVFMAMAVVAGLPEDSTKELQELIVGFTKEQEHHIDCDEIAELLSEMLNRISIMHVDVQLRLPCVGRGRLYGVLELSFRAESSSKEPPQVVELKFKSKHVAFVYNLDSVVLSAGERTFFETYGGAGAGSGLFLSLVGESVRRFMSTADELPLPNAHVSKLEDACGPIEMYDRLIHWMACADMQSQRSLAFANDQLLPAIAAFVQRDLSTFKQMSMLKKEIDEPTTDAGTRPYYEAMLNESKERVAGSPLVILARNILGRASLIDNCTRNQFFQIMRFCFFEREFLVPQIVLPKNSFIEPRVGELCNYMHPVRYLYEYGLPNAFAVYCHISALAIHVPINPSYCYPDTLNYFEQTLDSTEARLVLATLVKYSAADTLKLLRDNYVVRQCKAKSEQYYLSAALWVCLSASAARYEEIYQICDMWEYEAYYARNAYRLEVLRLKCELPSLCSYILPRAFPNGFKPEHLKALLQIYALLANTEAEYDGIYEAFVTYQSMLDTPFAVGYCSAAIEAYFNVYDMMSCSSTHGRTEFNAIPVDLLRMFIGKLKGLYLQSADSDTEHENAFSAIDEKLKDFDERYQKIMDRILREEMLDERLKETYSKSK